MKYSVIVCTFNPQPEQLEKVLTCLLKQTYDASQFEILVVDNNSPGNLSQLGIFSRMPQIRCVREEKQGLVYARLKGLDLARGATLVFVDDDNLLDKEYLSGLATLEECHPNVQVWGPGIVEVIYTAEAPKWIRDHYSWLFQKKNLSDTKYGSVEGWPEYYPAGSGMAVKKTLMEKYAQRFRSGQLSLTGRSGEQLSSGEDAQIVWTAVAEGQSAGSSPLLKLNHLIPPGRCSLKYLKKLNYGIALAYAKGLGEMFPGKNFGFARQKWYSRARLLLRQMMRSKFHPLNTFRFYMIERAWFRGIDDSIQKT